MCVDGRGMREQRAGEDESRGEGGKKDDERMDGLYLKPRLSHFEFPSLQHPFDILMPFSVTGGRLHNHTPPSHLGSQSPIPGISPPAGQDHIAPGRPSLCLRLAASVIPSILSVSSSVLSSIVQFTFTSSAHLYLTCTSATETLSKASLAKIVPS